MILHKGCEVLIRRVSLQLYTQKCGHRELGRLCTVGGNVPQLLWKTLGPPKIKHRITIRSSNSASGHIAQRIESSVLKTDADTHVHRQHYSHSVLAKNGNNSSVYWWMRGYTKRDIYIYILEYSSALKRKEMMTFVTTWVDLEDIMLSQISQSQKDPRWLHSHEVLRVVKFTGTKRRRVGTRGWEEGGGASV